MRRRGARSAGPSGRVHRMARRPGSRRRRRPRRVRLTLEAVRAAQEQVSPEEVVPGRHAGRGRAAASHAAGARPAGTGRRWRSRTGSRSCHRPVARELLAAILTVRGSRRRGRRPRRPGPFDRPASWTRSTRDAGPGHRPYARPGPDPARTASRADRLCHRQVPADPGGGRARRTQSPTPRPSRPTRSSGATPRADATGFSTRNASTTRRAARSDRRSEQTHLISLLDRRHTHDRRDPPTSSSSRPSSAGPVEPRRTSRLPARATCGSLQDGRRRRRGDDDDDDDTRCSPPEAFAPRTTRTWASRSSSEADAVIVAPLDAPAKLDAKELEEPPPKSSRRSPRT